MAGNISSEFLFHFTGSFENLKLILEKGFIPNYCLENWIMLDQNIPQIGIPMVSFCDIPEQFNEPHQLKYGPYGIAMNKSWGIAKKLTPITYVHKESFNYSAMQTIWDIYKKNENYIRKEDFIEEIKIPLLDVIGKSYKPGTQEKFENAFYSLFFLFKPFIGDDFSGKDICFYDEKEWRYYPFGVTPSFLHKEQYSINAEGKYVIDQAVWGTYKSNLEKFYPLTFTPEEVNKLFVETSAEKDELLKNLTNNSIIIEFKK